MRAGSAVADPAAATAVSDVVTLLVMATHSPQRFLKQCGVAVYVSRPGARAE